MVAAVRAAIGNVTPPNYRELLEAAREAAGIEEWPQNALRHSFASYHLARFNDAAALALELGHTNSNLVFQHYRQLVKPKQAERYWKIAPAVAGKKVDSVRRQQMSRTPPARWGPGGRPCYADGSNVTRTAGRKILSKKEHERQTQLEEN